VKGGPVKAVLCSIISWPKTIVGSAGTQSGRLARGFFPGGVPGFLCVPRCGPVSLSMAPDSRSQGLAFPLVVCFSEVVLSVQQHSNQSDESLTPRSLTFVPRSPNGESFFLRDGTQNPGKAVAVQNHETARLVGQSCWPRRQSHLTETLKRLQCSLYARSVSGNISKYRRTSRHGTE
jgi:hypothetical protein